MAKQKTIEYLNFNKTTNSELLELLNFISLLELIPPHTLARKILLLRLRELKKQYEFNKDASQSAAVAV